MCSVLRGKNILLGISGGIAAYKAADLTSRLRKEDAQVKVIMTANALNFIQPLTLESLSGNPVYHDTFQRTERWEIGHISLAKWADVVVVVPATANVLAKACHGIADDLLSTTILATNAKVIFAPAMNTVMYNKEVVQENIRILEERGYCFIPPACGRLACGDIGQGKLAGLEDILDGIKEALSCHQDLEGVRVLVTAGPTREYIDPVRFISNPSSGMMGYAIAQACIERGAVVDLVTGPTFIDPPPQANIYRVETAEQMYRQVMELYPSCKLVFKSAAVGDYRPSQFSRHKIKKDSEKLTLELVKNKDILKEMGRIKTHQVLVGFAAETKNLEDYAKKKLKEKNLDFILGNDVTQQGAGFQSRTNQGILFTRKGERIIIPLLDKKAFAHRLIDEVVKRASLSPSP